MWQKQEYEMPDDVLFARPTKRAINQGLFFEGERPKLSPKFRPWPGVFPLQGVICIVLLTALLLCRIAMPEIFRDMAAQWDGLMGYTLSQREQQAFYDITQGAGEEIATLFSARDVSVEQYSTVISSAESTSEAIGEAASSQPTQVQQAVPEQQTQSTPTAQPPAEQTALPQDEQIEAPQSEQTDSGDQGQMSPEEVLTAAEQQMTAVGAAQSTEIVYGETVYTNTGAYTLPVSVISPVNSGIVTSEFGTRISPFTGKPEFHDGLDIAVSSDTPILAVADGTVLKSDYDAMGGNFVKIDHGNGFVSGYFHLESFDVQAGQTVQAGDIIGVAGSTGASTGTHLHLMFYLDDVRVNPHLAYPGGVTTYFATS